MKILGTTAVGNQFSALIKEVEKGEEVIITRHGHPIAKIIPVVTKNRKSASRVIQLLREFAQQHKLAGLDWKMLRDEGRQ